MGKYYLFNEQTNTFLTDDNNQPVGLRESKKQNYEALFKLLDIDHCVFIDTDELAIHEYNVQVIDRE